MIGWRLGQSDPHGSNPAVTSGEPVLAVRVWRKKRAARRSAGHCRWRDGDELQVRFRVHAGLHVGLFSVNGRGELTLLEQYPPCDEPAELVYPAPEMTAQLGPPPGTELLLICGRSAGPVSEAEVRDAWGNADKWPALDTAGCCAYKLVA